MKWLLVAVPLLLTVAGCDDEDCNALECSCATVADCPTDFACNTAPEGAGGNVCYPTGQYPLGSACRRDTDCAAGLGCQDRMQVCVAQCGSDLAPCPDGTACQATDCLPFGSVPLLDVCDDPRLCAPPGECIFSVCAVPCTQGYTTNECPDDGTYCAVLDLVPACQIPLPSCSHGASCAFDRTCVHVGRDLGICRRPCTPAFDSNGAFVDPCTTQIGLRQSTCAPMGDPAVGVCIEAAASGGGPGTPCNNGNQLCAEGMICVSGNCRALCADSATCGGRTCTSIAAGFSACL